MVTTGIDCTHPLGPLPVPRRGCHILHNTGSGAWTPCPPGCRQDSQGRPPPGFLCAKYIGQKAEVGHEVTGQSWQHLPFPDRLCCLPVLTQGSWVQIPALPLSSCEILNPAAQTTVSVAVKSCCEEPQSAQSFPSPLGHRGHSLHFKAPDNCHLSCLKKLR